MKCYSRSNAPRPYRQGRQIPNSPSPPRVEGRPGAGAQLHTPTARASGSGEPFHRLAVGSGSRAQGRTRRHDREGPADRHPHPAALLRPPPADERGRHQLREQMARPRFHQADADIPRVGSRSYRQPSGCSMNQTVVVVELACAMSIVNFVGFSCSCRLPQIALDSQPFNYI